MNANMLLLPLLYLFHCSINVAAFVRELEIEKNFVPEFCDIKSAIGDQITWYYRGFFIDGMQFHRGTYTATLGAGQVIPGVDQGMMDMCVGEKRKLTIPYHLAYGVEGTQGIPPKTTLIFEVELQNIDRQNEKPHPKMTEVDIQIQKSEENCKTKSAEGDKIVWNYVGTFTDGTQFDKGTFSAVLGARHVIEGVDIAMRDMCVGDKRRMIIPPHLAYGDSGVEGVIPAGATLIFDVELLKIEPRDGRTEL